MAQPGKRVLIVGGGFGIAQCALALAELGAQVTVVTPSMELGSDPVADSPFGITYQELLRIRPLLLRAANHARICLYTNSRVENITRDEEGFIVKAVKYPRYVHQDLCTSCGLCEEACSVRVPFLQDGWSLTHCAIHPPLLGAKAVPSAYSIDKKGISPCRSACPLGINVQGFVSLMARGKMDEALALISEAAPLAGVLGRVCTHPCEDRCKRAEVDDPVFIRALHRYAADNASGGINYRHKSRAGSKREKVGIVGSGPAGLAAAWELARRGYSPIIFESRAVVGGMLATGIPRFRLPKEVREREVKAIEDLGVEIRTGITIGRDVTLSDLRERGYRAFFLAIGAHDNRMLEIPGEDLDGVVDSISLLFELNLKVGATVGRNVIVVGGGNSAIDSARTAMRRGKRTVTIMYRRTAEEMTAVKEDIEEAVKEGISIRYLTSVVEILGDGTRVTGIRCQKMELGEPGEDGRRRPVPIPGSEFVMEADHVVLAIGQRPTTKQLNVKGLGIDEAEATIKVDPLTLETSVFGVFAGGDCVTGPNSVVEAVAAGLRVAESIDRFLRGRNLRKDRTLERPVPVEIDVSERYASSHRRAEMPLIPRAKRMGSFEETSMGLPADVMERETGRCLNCALCSGCLECEQACGLGAVFHSDSAEEIDMQVDAIVNFTRSDVSSGMDTIDFNLGIHTVYAGGECSAFGELAQASSVALEVATELNLGEDWPKIESGVGGTGEAQSSELDMGVVPPRVQELRTGVILCRCGGSISSVIDFDEVDKRIFSLPGVCSVHRTAQACTQDGAREIADHAAERRLDRVLLAACRCCNLEQICFSCTDRRVMCLQHIQASFGEDSAVALEFVNIREQCAWVHKDDRKGATRKAIEIISAGIARSLASGAVDCHERSIQEGVLIVGTGLGALAAAKHLRLQGYSISLVSGPESDVTAEDLSEDYFENRNKLFRDVQELGVHVKSWPDLLELNGSPGNYKAVFRYGSEIMNIDAGALIFDLGEMGDRSQAAFNSITNQGLIERVLSRFRHDPEKENDGVIRGLTIGDTAGIFTVCPNVECTPDEHVERGEEVAVRVWSYLARGGLKPRATAVVIDSKLCRGCGECSAICSYIELRVKALNDETVYAYVDPALCLGCGACIACCPTGAIDQPLQGEREIVSTLESLLSCGGVVSEVV